MIMGINFNREEDWITWLLDLKELGIYDGMLNPYTNEFEIPEAREMFLRHVDTGVVYGYGDNPVWASYGKEEWKDRFSSG